MKFYFHFSIYLKISYNHCCNTNNDDVLKGVKAMNRYLFFFFLDLTKYCHLLNLSDMKLIKIRI